MLQTPSLYCYLQNIKEECIMTQKEIINKWENRGGRNKRVTLMQYFDKEAYTKNVLNARLVDKSSQYGVRIVSGSTVLLLDNSTFVVTGIFKSKKFRMETNPNGIILCGLKDGSTESSIISLDMCKALIKMNRPQAYMEVDFIYQLISISSLLLTCPEKECVVIHNFGKQKYSDRTLVYCPAESNIVLYENNKAIRHNKVDNNSMLSIYETITNFFFQPINTNIVYSNCGGGSATPSKKYCK
mgnify:CR=1 FL=1